MTDFENKTPKSEEAHRAPRVAKLADAAFVRAIAPSGHSADLAAATDIGKIIFADNQWSLPALLTRISEHRSYLQHSVDEIVRRDPHTQFRHPIWTRLDLPFGIGAPQAMLGRRSAAGAPATDGRVLLFKADVAARVLESMEWMLRRQMGGETAFGQNQFLSELEKKMPAEAIEGVKEIVVNTRAPALTGRRSCCPELQAFAQSPENPSQERADVWSALLNELLCDCALTYRIQMEISRAMANRIVIDESLHRPVEIADSPLFSPRLQAWGAHPFCPALDQARIDFSAVQFLFLYHICFHPAHGERVPDFVLDLFGTDDLPIDPLKDCFHTMNHEFLGWDQYPAHPGFLTLEAEIRQAYTCFGSPAMLSPANSARLYERNIFEIENPPQNLYTGEARDDWRSISADERYKAKFLPLLETEIFSMLALRTGDLPLTLVWLGVGSSSFELSFTQKLAALKMPERILVHELTRETAEDEAKQFRGRFSVDVDVLDGEFAVLKPIERRRDAEQLLLGMLGGTICNVDCGPTLRHLSSLMKPGDLLLIDTILAGKPDPRLLSGKSMTDTEKRWFWNGLRGLLPDADPERYSFEMEVDRSTPGGYDLVFKISEAPGCLVHKIIRTRRYERDYLIDTAASVGLREVQYGSSEYSGNIATLLFEKTPAAD